MWWANDEPRPAALRRAVDRLCVHLKTESDSAAYPHTQFISSNNQNLPASLCGGERARSTKKL